MDVLARGPAISWAVFNLTIVTTTDAPLLRLANRKRKLEIPLANVTVDIFSPLDKSLELSTSQGNTTVTYYFLAKTTAAAIGLYNRLQDVLGHKRAETIQISVPDLNVSLRLDGSAVAGKTDDERGAADAVIRRCIEMLAQTPQWTDVITPWTQEEHVALAWKRYDRLEWIFGPLAQDMYGTMGMSRTYDLELRPQTHYPTSTKMPDGSTAQEPAPIEGHLIRLTSQQGQERRYGKMVYKRLYFISQNQYLLFLKPAKATPMAADTAQPSATGNIAKSSDAHGSARRMGTEDPNRITNMMFAAKGFIYLCNVTSIRTFTGGENPVDEDPDEDPNTASTVTPDQSTAAKVDEDAILELVMKNGLIIRLQAASKSSRNEWMKRLRQLADYWTQRTKADMELYKTTREQNLKQLGIDERAEAVVGQFASKWEVSQSYASPVLYNVCGIQGCRPVHVSGTLYRKPRKHTTFTRCHVILTSGHLLVFQDTLRTRTGKKLLHIHHERTASMGLRGCYIYSGTLTEDDLLYQNQTFDSNAPGHHALPRIYLEDNWTSTDEDAMATFIIWHNGNKVVFQARSRAERDHWVLAIRAEIDKTHA